MSFTKHILPWLIMLPVGLVVLGYSLRPPRDEGRVDMRRFRRIPVVVDGRIKPIDTAARTLMRVTSGRDTFIDDTVPGQEVERSALEFFMELVSADDVMSSKVRKYKVFSITNDQVLAMLELKPRSGFKYSLDEFAGKLKAIHDKANEARKLESERRELELFDKSALALDKVIQEFLSFAKYRKPLVVPPSGARDWISLMDAGKAFVERMPKDVVEQARDDLAFSILKQREAIGYREIAELLPEQERAGFLAGIKQMPAKELAEILQGMIRDLTPRQRSMLVQVVRDRLPQEFQSEFDSMIDAEFQQYLGKALVKDSPRTPFEVALVAELNKEPAAKAWTEMLKAYRDSDRDRFAKGLDDYSAAQAGVSGSSYFRGWLEEQFNRAGLFYLCISLYVFAAILIFASWLSSNDFVLRSANSLIVLTLFIHTAGLCIRMYLQGRPPVTNLYSSAIFIGWGSVIIGLGLELFWRIGVGNLVGSTLGFLTCIVAHNLGSDRDTLEMMQAVLDTNFWLATHVTIVTLGYVATFIAGFLGILFIAAGVMTPALDDKLFKSLTQMLYGVICFAMMLSFTGTVLGGIWADQSWGRFWGWDSKENGAVLVVIWNAIILHARWGGLIKQRGMAVLAVGGSIVTAWSWFGTNMLGVGLHSYGFMDKAKPWLVGFWVSQLLIMGVGMIPTRAWRSYGQKRPEQVPVLEEVRPPKQLKRRERV